MLAAISRKELLGSGRQGRLYAIRTFHLLVLAGLALPALLQQTANFSSHNVFAASGAGESFARIFGIVEMVALLLMAPVLSVGAISRERAEGSLELLRVAGAHPMDIVTGKLLSRVATLSLFALSGIPLLLVGTLIGGVSGEMALLITCEAVAAATLGTAVGLAVSGYARGPIHATVVALGIIFTLYGASLIFVPLYFTKADALGAALAPILIVANAGDPSIPPGFAWLSVLSQLLLAISFLASAGWQSRGGGEETWRRREEAGVAFLEGNFLRRATAKRKSRRVVGNPIAWLDAIAVRRHFGPRVMRLFALITGGSVAVLSLVFAVLDRAPEDVRLPIVLLICGASGVTVLTAGAVISGERERNTLDLLRLTGMNSADIIAGKLGGLLAYLWPVVILPFIPALAFVERPFDVIAALVTAAIVIFTAASFGLMLSAFTKRSLLAAIVASTALITVVTAPIVVRATCWPNDPSGDWVVALFDPPFSVWGVLSSLGENPDRTVPLAAATGGLMLIFLAGVLFTVIASARVARGDGA